MHNPLIQSLNSFESEFEKLERAEQDTLALRETLSRNINKLSSHSQLKGNNSLSKLLQQIKQQLADAVNKWSMEWDERAAMRDLSEKYQDKIILLIFGKVNAGKSSFSNYLASCFKDEDVEYFYLDGGTRHYTKEKFKEGVTETTARIQGVELGSKLVLLDSPGLHSVTDENGDLTRRFTDSADLVLWLTPSTSPGQVQELEDLKKELESNKPLLPVITRSDSITEDFDENDELIQIIENKSKSNRELQEDDVAKRAKHKLNHSEQLKSPVSISVHWYKQSDKSELALKNSGLFALLESIGRTMDDARRFKSKKAHQQVVNYLEEAVLGGINKKITPQLSNLNRLIEEQNSSLERHKKEICSDLQLELADFIPDWANEFKQDKDTKKLAFHIQNYLETELSKRINSVIETFISQVKPVLVNINPDNLGNYEDMKVSYDETIGYSYKAASSGIGSGAGMLIGSMVAGPLGAAIGGLAGGYVGNKVGDSFIETITRTTTVGVGATQVATEAIKYVADLLPKEVDKGFKDWEQILDQLTSYSAEFSSYIADFKKEINEQKELLK